MTEFEYSESITIDASPDEVYDLVSDVTRTGEWSPVCRECIWNDGGAPRVGATFTGRNEDSGRTWETTSRVDVARRGHEFAWIVGDGYARWAYMLRPVEDGTELTESWQFREAGRDVFRTRYGDDAQAQIENRTRAARTGVPATLAAIKKIAESGA
ncbi:MAG: SRPBCC family protein [Jatrophihabitans sp.]